MKDTLIEILYRTRKQTLSGILYVFGCQAETSFMLLAYSAILHKYFQCAINEEKLNDERL